MPVCEMCGRGGNLVSAEIEGVELKVCNQCASFGKVKSHSSNYSHGFKPKFQKKEESEERIVDNYASLIRKARESRQMTQEDFAKLLQERESVLTKWESGSMPPSLETAKKIQHHLGINLIIKEESGEEVKQEKRRIGDDTLTLGDFIKIKKRN